jgi:hypothetical protein
MRGGRAAAFVLVWWVALFGWWVVLAGTDSALELAAAACAAFVVSVIAFGLRRRREARRLAPMLGVPWKVAREVGAIFWALALQMAGQRERSSRYRAFDLAASGEAPPRRSTEPAPVGQTSRNRHETVTPSRASDGYRP